MGLTGSWVTRNSSDALTRRNGLGVPSYIGFTLWFNRAALRREIVLWQAGLGDSPETNTDYWVRRRYSRLYIGYKPHVHWWRLVLIVRKGCLVAVSVRDGCTPSLVHG